METRLDPHLLSDCMKIQEDSPTRQPLTVSISSTMQRTGIPTFMSSPQLMPEPVWSCTVVSWDSAVARGGRGVVEVVVGVGLVWSSAVNFVGKWSSFV